MKKLEIKKEDLEYNLNKIKQIAKENHEEGKIPEIIGVVKANGMGLGLKEYAKFLVENDIKILAVANFEEAVILRDFGIENEIIMLSPVQQIEELEELIKRKVTLTISSLKGLEQVESLLKENEKINVHLKIDTGFGRYGVLYKNIEEIFNIFKNCKRVNVAGTYTHFSKAIDEKWTNLQFDRFVDVIEKIKKEGFNPGILHASASTAFLKYPKMHLDAVRIGSAIQGRTLLLQKEFKKIGNLKTEVAEIKELPKGYFISYNNSYKTKKNTKVAIIPIGYMDGLNKNKLRDDFSLKNNLISVGMEIKKIFKDNSLKVWLNDIPCKVIGKLGMYHAVVDITGKENINVGDIATLEVTPLQTNEKIRREYI